MDWRSALSIVRERRRLREIKLQSELLSSIDSNSRITKFYSQPDNYTVPVYLDLTRARDKEHIFTATGFIARSIAVIDVPFYNGQQLEYILHLDEYQNQIKRRGEFELRNVTFEKLYITHEAWTGKMLIVISGVKY